MPRSFSHDMRALGGKVKQLFVGYPGWVGGVIAGIQGALMPYLVVVILSLAVIASDPGATTSNGIEWGSAFSVATSVWLMAHGVPATASGVTFTLLPAGLTLLCGFVTAAGARRFATRSWMSWGLAVGSYVATVIVIGSFTLGSEPDGGSLVVRAATVAALIAGAATAAGIWRAYGASFEWALQLPDYVRRGLRRGFGTLAWGVAAASLVSIVAVVMHADDMATWATGLGVDAIGGVVLAIAQLAYAPTFVVWMLAYLTGTGFSVGVGTAYSPGVAQAEALPQVPLLAALPDATWGWLAWVPLVLVAVGAAARWVTRTRERLAWADAAADAVALSLVTVVAAGMAATAAGAVGPGRLAQTGPDVLPVTAAMLGLTLAGYAVVTVVIAIIDLWARRSGVVTESRSPSQSGMTTETVTTKSGT
ncbi:DUF6350 family protein [Demequina sp. B12]|uniref:cell division protein PerM n=1 Tax=Demequina sp. B12 TaxID=2992757 RepID=UPI00237A85D1|nr:DUF6350 family protein [Demequina sp. B12]MDE0572517.1 DUF6350 family protein [Demequina sp. B12]